MLMPLTTSLIMQPRSPPPFHGASLPLCSTSCSLSQLHTTGLRYKTTTRVKRVSSKRSLHDEAADNAAARSSLSTAHAQAAAVLTATSPSKGAKRGSVAPLMSTDILTQDAVTAKESKRALKRAASKRKIQPGEAKETTFVYEEKELKLAVCCTIA